MFWFFLVVTFLTIASVLVAWSGRRDEEAAGPLRTVALFMTAVLIAVGVIASTSMVPQRNVGIVTEFGKATGRETGAGLKFTAPWQNVEDWDASNQAYDHRGDGACVKVRIATLADACVEVLIEWRARADRASDQWAAYKKDFTLFTGRRVDPAITLSLNDAFGAYNPLANIDAKTGNLNVPTGPLTEQVKAALTTRLGNDVEILSVIVTRVNHDEKTQTAIDAFQASILKARVLEQDKKNAELQKQISETNAKSDAVTRCLELADKHGKEPGFCLGGGNPVQQR